MDVRFLVRRLAWALLIVLAVGAIVFATKANSATPPDRPSWVAPDGRVLMDRAPAWFREAVPGRDRWGWVTKAERFPTPPPPGAAPNPPRPIYAERDVTSAVVGYLP